MIICLKKYTVYIYLNNRMLNNVTSFLPYVRITFPCPKCQNISKGII